MARAVGYMIVFVQNLSHRISDLEISCVGDKLDKKLEYPPSI